VCLYFENGHEVKTLIHSGHSVHGTSGSHVLALGNGSQWEVIGVSFAGQDQGWMDSPSYALRYQVNWLQCTVLAAADYSQMRDAQQVPPNVRDRCRELQIVCAMNKLRVIFPMPRPDSINEHEYENVLWTAQR